MPKMKIAVVSTDGFNVDNHFGKAERFLIYEMDDKLKLIDLRVTETWSVGDPNHSFDADKFKRVASVLSDCDRIYMTKIGEVPAAKLKEIGVEPVVYSGSIENIITAKPVS